jgi:putative phage-type endonuclease
MNKLGDTNLLDYGTRENWLAGRGSGVGASESAALFGVSPWDTPVSLWAKKTGRLIEEVEGEWIRWGNLLEEPIAKAYEETTLRKVVQAGPFCVAQHPTVACMRSTPDRFVVEALDREPDGIVQIKNTNAAKRHDWDNGVPGFIEIQVQHEMACTGRRWASVAVLIGGCEFRYFDVERNQNFIDELEEQCRIFWGYVERDEQPPVDPSERTLEVLKKLHPADNGQTIELPPEAAVWWEQLAQGKQAIKDGKSLKDAAEVALRNAIGDASYGLLPDGRKLSALTTQNPGYAQKALVEPYTYRTLREVKETKKKSRKK